MCQKVLRANTNWGHTSIGPTLRSMAISQELLQDTISNGQIVDEVRLAFVPIMIKLVRYLLYCFKSICLFQSIVNEIINNELLKNRNANGIVIDGYPRNIGQLNYFEKKV